MASDDPQYCKRELAGPSPMMEIARVTSMVSFAKKRWTGALPSRSRGPLPFTVRGTRLADRQGCGSGL